MKISLSLFILFSVSIVMLQFLVQGSLDSISSELNSDTTFFNYEGSHIRQFDTTGNYTLDEDISGQLPAGSGAVDIGEGVSFFTDPFAVIKNWVLDFTGAKYVIGVANAFPNFLKLIFRGSLSPIAFAIGYLWNIAFVFALVFWIKGGGD